MNVKTRGFVERRGSSSFFVNGDLLIRPALTDLPATKKFREASKKAKSNLTELPIHHEHKVTDV